MTVDQVAHMVAYVELDVPGFAPGPRIITNIVDCDPESVAVGQRVTAVFDDTASGHALVRFHPV
ncbi:MAG: OB-fold domain-containing protein [Acidimicrobiales bacterium]|nr:OB-fold domain-containing protein [Acidimicrobiales bacterium]